MNNNVGFTPNDNQKLKWLFIVILLIFSVLSAFYGYFHYVDRVEKKLSQRVEDLLIKKEKPFEQWKKSLKKKEKKQAKEDLMALSQDFKNLYLEMPKRNNAIRSGLQHAFLEWELGHKKVAEDFLLQMRQTSKKNPFSGAILHSLAILCVERGAYDQAMSFIDHFVKKHPKDFLLGEMLFIKARILSQKELYRESFAVYKDILANEDLSLYSNLVDIEISYFEAMNFDFIDQDAVRDKKMKDGKMEMKVKVKFDKEKLKKEQ